MCGEASVSLQAEACARVSMIARHSARASEVRSSARSTVVISSAGKDESGTVTAAAIASRLVKGGAKS